MPADQAMRESTISFFKDAFGDKKSVRPKHDT